MRFTPSGVYFTIAALSKTRRSGPPLEVTYFSFKDDPKICPVASLHAYLEATETKRSKKENRLFISFRKPHLPVTTTSISRWLKEAISMAGIKGFTGHSTRAASTSAAKGKGVSTADILKAGNWSRESTFQRFYNKTIEGNYVQAVFQGHDSAPSVSTDISIIIFML